MEAESAEVEPSVPIDFTSGAVLSRLLSPMMTRDAIQSLSPTMKVAEGACGNDGDVRPMRWGRSRR
jgi:hypothetical protein